MPALRRLPWPYLIIAYGWSWVIWIAVAFTRTDYQSSPALTALLLLGVFGPGIGGIFLTYRNTDRARRRDFWRRLLDLRRLRWQWIAFMLVLWPALQLAANGAAQALGQPVPPSGLVAQLIAQPPFLLLVVILYFLQAALEDLGWRGYMGEHLLHSQSPGTAAVLVGVFHAFWHLPLFFVVGTNQMKMGLGPEFWLFVVQVIAFSVAATWCYVDNRHSTLAAILLHTAGNLCNDLFNLSGSPLKLQLYTLLMLVAALAVHAWMSRSGRRAARPAIQEAAS